MGLDVNEFTGKLDEHFICGICLDVLDEPFNTPCGHVFCRDCIFKSLETNNFCPLDRKLLEKKHLSPAHSISGLIGNLQVKCQFSDNGCKHLCPRNNLSTHVKSCRFKPSTQTVCYGCRQKIPVKDQKTHACKFLLKQEISSLKETLVKLTDDLGKKEFHLHHIFHVVCAYLLSFQANVYCLLSKKNR